MGRKGKNYENPSKDCLVFLSVKKAGSDKRLYYPNFKYDEQVSNGNINWIMAKMKDRILNGFLAGQFESASFWDNRTKERLETIYPS